MLTNCLVNIANMSETPDTASQILDAAEEVFAGAGFAGARVQAIADRAGVNKAMLYYYFDSKAGLYRAVLERGFAQLTSLLSQHIEQTDHADIQGFLAGYRRFLREHPSLARLIMRDMVDGAPHIREILGPKVPRVLGGMGTALERGQREGWVNPDINPMIAAPILVAPFVLFAIAGPILADSTGAPEPLLRAFEQTAEEILLRGLLSRPEEP